MIAKVFIALTLALLAQAQLIPVPKLVVASVSSEWTPYYSPSVNGYATNVLPTDPYDTNWNAAVPNQPTPSIDWIVFDVLQLSFNVSQFTYSAYGDGTHDPQNFVVQRGISANGPWYDVLSATGLAGTNATQVFNLPTATAARYWRWKINTKVSAYQSYVREVNFLGFPTTIPQPLNEFVVADSSVQGTPPPSFVNNLLPTVNPSASPSIAWNSGGVPTPVVSWITFDVKSAQSLRFVGFQYANAIGDSIHDVYSFRLLVGNSANGPWQTVLNVGPTALGYGTTGVNTYTFGATSGRFWKWDGVITAPATGSFQVVVSYVNFLTLPAL